jgi:hypothetical protein
MPARKRVSPGTAKVALLAAMMRQPDSKSPAAIQPMVPHTRMRPNSSSESFRLIMAIELVSARVGA